MVMTPQDRLLTWLGFGATGDLGPLTGYTNKRGKLVWFLKAPPTTPPAPWQIHQRNKFRLVARAWNGLSDAARYQWHLAELRGHLNVTAYNLFTWWSLIGDDAIIRTIEHQTGTNLIS